MHSLLSQLKSNSWGSLFVVEIRHFSTNLSFSYYINNSYLTSKNVYSYIPHILSCRANFETKYHNKRHSNSLWRLIYLFPFHTSIKNCNSVFFLERLTATPFHETWRWKSYQKCMSMSLWCLNSWCLFLNYTLSSLWVLISISSSYNSLKTQYK